MNLKLPPVYPITDKRLSGKSSHLAIVRELIRGGATFIQIRDKETPLDELLNDLRRCVEYAARFRVMIIVNDRCDLALVSGAAGVHLGQDDLPPMAARAVVGRDCILGFSTHSLAQIRQGNRLPIQYVGFGPIFGTATKTNPSPIVGIDKLRQACRQSAHSVVAIGGIDLAQLRVILEAGASSAAIISALMRTKNLARRMEQFLRAAEPA
jgi:thiamine-phosphate pyrophosphorylase